MDDENKVDGVQTDTDGVDTPAGDTVLPTDGASVPAEEESQAEGGDAQTSV